MNDALSSTGSAITNTTALTNGTSGNIRYYGASAKNYVDIGDRDSSGNKILWRIIGVFDVVCSFN